MGSFSGRSQYLSMRSTRFAVGGTIGRPSPQPRSRYNALIASKSSSASMAAPGAFKTSLRSVMTSFLRPPGVGSKFFLTYRGIELRHRDECDALGVRAVAIVQLHGKILQPVFEEHDFQRQITGAVHERGLGQDHSHRQALVP